MSKPAPILIGFFPKKTARPDSWFGETNVEEICSVSNCISKGPENWINHWKHNTIWWMYDTEEAAREIARDDTVLYDIYAYRLFPVKFESGREELITIASEASGDLRGYDILGYDIVSRSEGTNFECSPLSCNKGCAEFAVNRFCLIDELEEAWRIAVLISKDSNDKGTWEPGPYFLCIVHRKIGEPSGELERV